MIIKINFIIIILTLVGCSNYYGKIKPFSKKSCSHKVAQKQTIVFENEVDKSVVNHVLHKITTISNKKNGIKTYIQAMNVIGFDYDNEVAKWGTLCLGDSVVVSFCWHCEEFSKKFDRLRQKYKDKLPRVYSAENPLYKEFIVQEKKEKEKYHNSNHSGWLKVTKDESLYYEKHSNSKREIDSLISIYQK